MKLPPVGLVMVPVVMLSGAPACAPTPDRSPPAAERLEARIDRVALPDAQRPKVRLKGHALDLLEPAPPVPFELDLPQVVKKEHTAKRPVKWIVQFRSVISAEHQRELAALGARTLEYIPDHAVIVAMDDDVAERVKAHGAVRAAARVRPAYKIDPRLKDDAGAVARWNGLRRLAVRFDEAEGFEAALSEVHRSRGQVLHVSRGVVTMSVPSPAVARLARLESVGWIEEVPELRLLNDTASWTIQSSRPDVRSIWAHGLRGDGQIVGVGDTGLDHDMCFFRDPAGVPFGPSHRKVVGYGSFADAYDGDMGHGSHVAGTVAGDQSPVTGSSQGSGMAPGARLFMTDLTPGEVSYVLAPSDLGEMFIAPYLAGARLHTNSWGAPANAYDAFAWSADRFAWEHKDFLPLFANGNSGPGTRSVGTPATAKNVVSVGATLNGASAGDVAAFSSHGGTMDGRTKPTLVAPGVELASADSDGVDGTRNCGTRTMSGTSMATPVVAGAAALVRQYYVEGYWPFGVASPAHAREPSAALVKATLINSAQGISGQFVDGPIPATGQGWGRLTLDRTLRFAGDATYLEVFDVQDGLQSGAAWTETVFASGERPLKVTLVWTDFPGSSAAEIALVNDLDLRVTAPDGASYAGNDFEGGASVAGGLADRLNVEEQVLVATPQRGRYAVAVSAHQVVFGPQPFAVVVTGGAAVTSSGFLGLDRSRYGDADTIRLEVSDLDPNADPAAAEEIAVTVASGVDEEVIAATESGPDAAVFVGALPTSAGAAVPGDGVLQVSDGTPIVATYLDADDGSGAPAVSTASAVGDLTPPRISAVAVPEIGQGSATVSWVTDEPTSGRVDYGPTAALGESRATPWLTTVHAAQLPALREVTEYRFVVVARDEAGNVAIDSNGGAQHAFTTVSLPPELTAYSSNSTATYLAETVIYGIATDPSGVSSVVVNDRPVAYRATDGYYELSFALAMGPNPFVVLATDGLGNVSTAQLVVTRLPPPDLTISSLSGPPRGGIGERIRVEQTVCNAGEGAASGSGIIAWFLSLDETISPGGDVPISDAVRYADEIAASECVPISVDVTIPLNLALVGSTRVLGSIVDLTDELVESSEANNARAGPSIALEGPDLAVSSVSAPSSIETGVEFVVPVTVANRGLGAAGAFAVGVYLSLDETVTMGDVRLGSSRPGGLRAGAVVELPYRATVGSSVPPGEYFVGAIADLGDELPEPNESDNALVGARVTVRGPDLVATAVAGPASASGGSTVSLTATVAEGGGGATSAFTVGLYLSGDATIDRSDRRIGAYQVPGLARGASHTATTAVVLPTDLEIATYRIGAIADDGEVVMESDEGNNAVAGPSLSIIGADLFMLRVAGPTTALPGGTARVTTTVGTSPTGAPASGFYVGIFLSSDPAITASDTMILARYVDGLAPGAESVEDTTLMVPWVAEGTYYLGAIADNFAAWVCDVEADTCWWVVDAVRESDETNNVMTGNAVFVGRRPDLALAAVAAPATATPGASVTVSTTVTNAGNLAAAPCRLGIFLSSDATVGGGDLLLGTRAVPGLAPGTTSTEATTVTLPAAGGTYWIGAVADLDGAVAEADEANNTLTASAALTVGQPDLAQPDLAVISVTGPGSALVGATISVATLVANQGDAPAPPCTLGIYASTDEVITASDTLLSRETAAGLAPGAWTSVSAVVAIPLTLRPGGYYLGAIADLDGAVGEADESDNGLTGTHLNVRKAKN